MIFGTWIFTLFLALASAEYDEHKMNEHQIQDLPQVEIPFGQAVGDIFKYDVVKKLLEGEIPMEKQMGISMLVLYAVRCARLALQFSHPRVNEINGFTLRHSVEFEDVLVSDTRYWIDHDTRENWVKLCEMYTQLLLELEPRKEDFARLESFVRIPYSGKLSQGTGLKFVEEQAKIEKWDGKDFSKQPTVQLGNGIKMPRLGLGTWFMQNQDGVEMMVHALKTGYRHLDTAQGYWNEKDVGEAIRKSGVPREEIFLATKLSMDEDFGKGRTRKRFDAQLKDLGVEYVDLYMIHGPIGDKARMKETWKEMEQIFMDRKAKAIGVSNYDSFELKELLTYAVVKPVVVQNKFDVFTLGSQTPWFPSPYEVAKTNHLAFVGYSPINSFPWHFLSIDSTLVKSIASKYENKTPAQVVLRWVLQCGVTALTRSMNGDHLEENFNVFDFELEPGDVRMLTGIIQLTSPWPVGSVFDIYQVDQIPHVHGHDEL